MKKLVVLSGAGVSAESGIPTFRDSGGLWEGHRIEDVATPAGWARNPEHVLNFYNERRKRALAAQPNEAHRIIAALEQHFDVAVVTQNVDDLHERAGSTNVVHLHGSLFQARSTADPTLVYPIRGEALNLGDLCEKGSQLRPHIVWFGETVPAMMEATQITSQADVLVVVGTSLVVYPAAGLVHEVPAAARIFVVDPGTPDIVRNERTVFVREKASRGMAVVREMLLGY
ncbi:MAG: NAD-dependent deacylase [Cyclobacteriaceae bacterium]|nr:NAD-dependent deacylase [Cyclobacteriaceae bacterium]